jgi:hypothetical protein
LAPDDEAAAWNLAIAATALRDWTIARAVWNSLGLHVARHSGWQARVNQDDKGSRGVPIMPLMVVAGKDQGSA